MDALDDDMLEPERAALHEGQAQPLVEASVGSLRRKLDYVPLGETSLAADRFGFAGPRPPAEDILAGCSPLLVENAGAQVSPGNV